MRVNNNISSLNAWRNLNSTDGAMSKSLERLSSGYRINRAGDDVAGLAISENMRAQITGLNQAVKNSQDGISLLQTAEGSLNEVHSMLQRMRELAVQSANGTLQPEDRKPIQAEMDNLAKEVTRVTNATQFNGKDLIDGSLQKAGGPSAYSQGGIDQISLQIGPNAGQNVAFEVGAMDAKSLGITRDVMTSIVFSNTGIAPAVANVNGGTFINSVNATDAVNAGMSAGTYQVRYDSQAKTVQLFDKSGTAVGTAVSAVDSANATLSSVTIGDKNTAQQVTINLKAALPAAATGITTDWLNIGSRVGSYSGAAAAAVVNNTVAGDTGITSVGWGINATAYKIQVTGAAGSQTIQLQDSTGVAIGSAVTYTGAANYTVGDNATGKSVSVQALLVAGGTTSTDAITVTNNGQAAEDAKFTGGVKYGSSQVFGGLNVSSSKGAEAAITAIDGAIAKVSYQRSQMGAIQNRLEHTINNLQVVSENLTASESRIRDVDMALEMTNFTKHQILMQSGTAMLAQANQKNQSVLSLLK